jgi:small subunit ribosomal protein S9
LEKNFYYGTGKRKSSVARVFMHPGGTGTFIINKRTIDEYFDRETSKMIIRQPLELTATLNKFDFYITVKGGGKTGQSGAIRHGLTKALLKFNAEFRKILKKAGLITRDPRVKERKKYGQKGARARFQFSKR